MALGEIGLIKILCTFAFIFFVTLLSSCTHGSCRRDGEMLAASSNNMPLTDSVGTKTDNIHEPERTFVYKYDGSQQCGLKKGIPVAEMAKSLKSIKVFSQENRSDGLMHIQVCGAPTGRANVYEIYTKDLIKAESFGFKKWTY